LSFLGKLHSARDFTGLAGLRLVVVACRALAASATLTSGTGKKFESPDRGNNVFALVMQLSQPFRDIHGWTPYQ